MLTYEMPEPILHKILSLLSVTTVDRDNRSLISLDAEKDETRSIISNINDLKMLRTVSHFLHWSVSDYLMQNAFIDYTAQPLQYELPLSVDTPVQGLRMLNENTLLAYAPFEKIKVVDVSSQKLLTSGPEEILVNDSDADDEAMPSPASADGSIKAVGFVEQTEEILGLLPINQIQPQVWDQYYSRFKPVEYSLPPIRVNQFACDPYFVAAVPLAVPNGDERQDFDTSHYMLEISYDDTNYNIRIHDVANGLLQTVFTYPVNKRFSEVFSTPTHIINDISIFGVDSEFYYQAVCVYTSNQSLYEIIIHDIQLHHGVTNYYNNQCLEAFNSLSESGEAQNYTQITPRLLANPFYYSFERRPKKPGDPPSPGGSTSIYRRGVQYFTLADGAKPEKTNLSNTQSAENYGRQDIQRESVNPTCVCPLLPNGAEQLSISADPSTRQVTIRRFPRFFVTPLRRDAVMAEDCADSRAPEQVRVSEDASMSGPRG